MFKLIMDKTFTKKRIVKVAHFVPNKLIFLKRIFSETGKQVL